MKKSKLDGVTTVRTKTYIAFWMDSPLCNWYRPAPFEYEGKWFSNSEAAMMYAKAKFFHDLKAMRKIYEAEAQPGQCKFLGRGIRNFKLEEWEPVRERLVYTICLAKFESNPKLAKYLLRTEDRILIEASPQDHIWGNGLRPHDPCNADERHWKGLNLLGKVLMRVRAELQRRLAHEQQVQP